MMNADNDSIRLIEQFKLRIKEKSIIHQSLLEYLSISDGENNKLAKKEEKYVKLLQILKEKNITTNKCEFREFLATISHLWEMHQSKKEIKCKTEILLKLLKEVIKSTFSEDEIFKVFRFNRNYYVLLILLELNILSVETILKNIDLKNYAHRCIIEYFYPEIREYDSKFINDLMNNKFYGLRWFVEENVQNLDFFYSMRKEGKKEPKIIELIRGDKIEEFISFIEHFPIDINDEILKEETIFYGSITTYITPIGYSALFGSISIFKYLYMKEAKIENYNEDDKSDIFEYAIQGRNYEIIHLLEERKEIKEELNNQEKLQKYLKLSIQMHHNEICEYFITNYDIQVTEEIIYLIIIYKNYQLFDLLIERNNIEFKDMVIITNIFCSICGNGNEEIVKIMINHPNLDINSKDYIFHHSFEMTKMNKKS